MASEVITKIDMHNHTTLGPDSVAEPEDSVGKAIEAGLDGIAFTEHNSYLASEPVEALREKYGRRLKIFRGVEYTAEEGHVLLFGVKDDDFFGLGLNAPVSEIIEAANRAGAAAILPHPFREWLLMRADLTLLSGVCAIEAYNGHNNDAENERALLEARVLNLPTTGGSDSHNSGEVGACYTEFMTEVTYDNFIDALKGGLYRGVGWRASG